MQQVIYLGKEALTVLVIFTLFLLYLDDADFAEVLFKIPLPEFYKERVQEQFESIFKRSADDVRK